MWLFLFLLYMFLKKDISQKSLICKWPVCMFSFFFSFIYFHVVSQGNSRSCLRKIIRLPYGYMIRPKKIRKYEAHRPLVLSRTSLCVWRLWYISISLEVQPEKWRREIVDYIYPQSKCIYLNWTNFTYCFIIAIWAAHLKTTLHADR